MRGRGNVSRNLIGQYKKLPTMNVKNALITLEHRAGSDAISQEQRAPIETKYDAIQTLVTSHPNILFSINIRNF
ncbi:Beta-ketoacyl-[acyl-carrier-protein] synthase III [Trichinella spiralis]|uniref:Beta-ketoacyl-[acyl-carrier-protein] synthase III n=1 Tax=Trichinella spiralis TaxID=6334 RepID=A0ABR3KG69_TRISP